MLKKLFLSGLILSISIMSAQDTKKEAETVKTKMEVFSSKTGSITRFVDSKLPAMNTTYENLEQRVRKISNNNASLYFYQLVKSGKYGNTTASIEYTDLLELIKALQTLKGQVDKDVADSPDYMENKFTTVDGFQLGYYVSKGKPTWYIKLEKYGSDNTVFIDKAETIESAFNLGKSKIEEIKAK